MQIVATKSGCISQREMATFVARPNRLSIGWAMTPPPPEPSPFLTDTQALREGKVTATVLSSDLNYRDKEQLPDWLSSPEV